MGTIKRSIWRSYKVEIESKITNVFHGVPTWVYNEGVGTTIKNPCPVCNKEMNLIIGHGEYIETCSIIELDGMYVIPIHTECYEKITFPHLNT